MDWTPAIVGQDYENEQNSKRNRWDNEEVGGDQVLHVVFQESTPSLRRRLSMSDDVLGDTRLRQLNAEFQ